MKLQSFTKCLRETLVFMRKSALWGKVQLPFFKRFLRVLTIFSGGGLSTRQKLFEVLSSEPQNLFNIFFLLQTKQTKIIHLTNVLETAIQKIYLNLKSIHRNYMYKNLRISNFRQCYKQYF